MNDCSPGISHPDDLAFLRLLHLADSALPIGALAHSFGMETLVAKGLLDPDRIESFLRGYLEEAGRVESAFCAEGARLGREGSFSRDRWQDVNQMLRARRASREARAASAALGRNFLVAAAPLMSSPIVNAAVELSLQSSDGDAFTTEHAPAFGLIGGVLGLEERRVLLAYLHQLVSGFVSACQRLLPLGQSQAARILWNLKASMVEAAARGAECEVENACSFTPLLDWGAMEHPALATRLFIS